MLTLFILKAYSLIAVRYTLCSIRYNIVVLFKKKVEKEEWEEQYLGHVKGWHCSKLSEFPGLKHLFTSKYNDLNLAKHALTIFPEKSVDKNREILCKSLELKYENLLTLPLEHGDKVLIVDDNLKGLIKCDAAITRYKDVPLLVTAADCVPIILYCEDKSILGVVHAGWKSTAKNIVEKTVISMIENFMVRPSQIIAAIGPAIGQANYEVDDEVAKQLIEATGSEDFVDKKWRKPKVDLKLANKIQLEKIGVNEIYVSDLNTARETSLLYSHRVQGKRAGRQGLIACLTEVKE